jgi:hypothetical protein
MGKRFSFWVRLYIEKRLRNDFWEMEICEMDALLGGYLDGKTKYE